MRFKPPISNYLQSWGQERVSDLARGKIDRFSVDSLIEMLGHAGADVSFVVTTDRQVA